MVIQFILNRNVKLLRTEAKQIIATKAVSYSSYGTYSKVKWSRRKKKNAQNFEKSRNETSQISSANSDNSSANKRKIKINQFFRIIIEAQRIKTFIDIWYWLRFVYTNDEITKVIHTTVFGISQIPKPRRWHFGVWEILCLQQMNHKRAYTYYLSMYSIVILS